jgi:membrane associated rhomboid family serine protease
MKYAKVTMAPPLTRMTRNIIIACVVSFFAFFLADQYLNIGGRVPSSYLALVPSDLVNHYWLWQPFTYIFLHGSPFHILVNMLLLWFFGPELEMRMGERRFLMFFLLCGAVGGIFNAGVNYAFFPEVVSRPIIGASGAVYGILGGFSLLFYDRYIVLWFLFPIQAKYFAPSIFLLDFASTMGSKQDAVAHFTHMGGMIAGAAFTYFMYFRQGGGRGKSKRDLEKEKLKRQFTLIVNESVEKSEKENSGPYWN